MLSSHGLALRPLGAFENHFAAFGEVGLPIFCARARVTGKVGSEELERAAAAVQARHGILASAIRRGDGNRRALFRSANPLPVEIREGADARWQDVAALEVIRPFDVQDGPLARLTSVQDHRGTDILLTMHHAIADGMSAVMVLRDLLLALSGERLTKHDTIETMDELLAADLPAAFRAPTAIGSASLADERPWFERTDNLPTVRDVTLNRDLTDGIIAAARAQGTTVHSALSVALARVLHRNGIVTADGAVRVVSPVNVRPYLNDTQQCGLFFSGMMDAYKPSSLGFWEDARAAHAAMAPYRSRGSAISTVVKAARLSRRDDSAEAAKNAMRAIVNRELLISNLGRIGVPEQYGHLELESITGPIMSQCVHGDNIVGAATFRGEMQLVHTTIDGYAHLLEETVDLLRSP